MTSSHKHTHLPISYYMFFFLVVLILRGMDALSDENSVSINEMWYRYISCYRIISTWLLTWDTWDGFELSWSIGSRSIFLKAKHVDGSAFTYMSKEFLINFLCWANSTVQWWSNLISHERTLSMIHRCVQLLVSWVTFRWRMLGWSVTRPPILPEASALLNSTLLM